MKTPPKSDASEFHYRHYKTVATWTPHNTSTFGKTTHAGGKLKYIIHSYTLKQTQEQKEQVRSGFWKWHDPCTFRIYHTSDLNVHSGNITPGEIKVTDIGPPLPRLWGCGDSVVRRLPSRLSVTTSWKQCCVFNSYIRSTLFRISQSGVTMAIKLSTKATSAPGPRLQYGMTKIC